MAQQYPQTPTYGNPYQNMQTFYPPFQTNGLHQPPYNPSPVHQPNHQYPNAYTPSTNSQNFQMNAQPPAQGHPFPFPPPPFSRDMLKQFGNATVPPPPPPNFVPLPTNGFEFAQFGNNGAHHGVQPNPYFQNVPSGPLPAANTVNPSAAFPHMPGAPSHATSNTHLGSSALNLDGAAQSTGHSERNPHHQFGVDTTHESRGYTNLSDRTSAGPIPKQTPTRFPDSRNTNAVSLQHMPDESDTLSLQTSLNPPSLARTHHQGQAGSSIPQSVERKESSPSYRPPSPTKPVASVQTDLPTQNSTRMLSKDTNLVDEYSDQPLPELRKLAKSALMSMLAHNINYSILTQEGIEASLLRTLYNELGVNVQTPDPEKEDGRIPDVHAANQDAQQPGSKAAPSEALPPSTATTVVDQSFRSQEATPPAIKPASSVVAGLERKDRIALLLAARKSGASKTPPLPSNTSGQEIKQATSLPGLSQTSAADVNPTTLGDQAPTGQSGTNSTNASGLDSQPPISELSSSTKSVATAALPPVASTNAQILQKPVMADLKTKTASIQLTALATPVREELVRTGFSSLIPGLFMTDDTSARDGLMSDSTMQALSTEKHAASTSNSDQFSLDTEPLRLPRKRPVASDLFNTVIEPDSKRSRSSTFNHPPVPFLPQSGIDEDASDGEIVEETRHAQDRPSQVVKHPSSVFPATSKERQPQIPSIAEEMQNALDKNIITGGALASAPTRMNGNLSSMLRPGPMRSLSKLTPEQLTERAAALKAGLVRRNREKILASGIPELEKEIKKTEARIAELRITESGSAKKAVEYEAIAARERTAEHDARNEANELATQLESSLSTLTRFQIELEQIQDESSAAQSNSKITSTSEREMEGVNRVATSAQVIENQSTSSEFQHVPIEQQQQQPDSLSGHTSVVSNADTSQKSPVSGQSASPQSDNILPMPRSHAEDELIQSSNISSVSIEMESNSSQAADLDDADDVDEMEDQQDFTSHDYGQVSPDEQVESGYDSAMLVDGDSDGSISMSDSGSERMMEEDGEGGEEEEADYEPEIENSYTFDKHSDEDEYEPADVDEYNPEQPYVPEDYDIHEGTRSHVSRRQSRTSEPTARRLDDEESVEDNVQTNGVPEVPTRALQTTPSEPVNGSKQASSSLSSSEAGEMPESGSAVTPQNNDDQESGLELSEANTMTKPQPPAVLSEEADTDSPDKPANGPVHFVPYKTPLSGLRSFRFHPQFAELVKTGYRSLTYSNDINAQAPLCPTELQGESCTDPQCEEQHFKQMGLPDDRILVQMSSANDLKDKAERDRYLVGLKQIIAGLRQRGVKDFESVADSLSAYRRQFLAEPASM